jgi:RecA/RadA recombinase
MGLLNDLVKNTGNEYASIVEDGVSAGDVAGWIDTGSYALNALVSGSLFGGLPSNKVTALAGESTTGKTYFTLGIIKNFLRQNPDGIVMFFESESAISKKMMEERGLDTKRIAIVPVETVEQFKTQALRAVDMYLEAKGKKGDAQPPMMMALDSLGMLSTSKEMADSAEGKEVRDMTRSQIVKAAFRTLTLKLGKANIPLIITNHVYEVIGKMYAEKEMGGGSGLKYAASSTIFLTKAKARGEDIGGGSADKSVVGSIITATAAKSRLTKEGSKVKTMLTYDRGLSRYFWLLEMGLEAGIIEQVGSKYSILGRDKVFKKNILGSPKEHFDQEFLEALDVWVGQNFTYANLTEDEAFEQLMENDDDVGPEED